MMEVLLLLAVLVCPIVMGGMMVAMIRHMRGGATDRDRPSGDGPR